jgi:exodeoxyribonuclease VII small subunit
MASFEDQLTELEKVVEQLEGGDLTLEESVGLFERGVKLSDACKGQLASAESRIQVLLEPESGGVVRVEDLDVPIGEEDLDEDEDDIEADVNEE